MKKKFASIVLTVLVCVSAISLQALAANNDMSNTTDSNVVTALNVVNSISESLSPNVANENGDNMSVPVVQESISAREITITKKIPIKDIVWDHGNPTFIYCLKTIDGVSLSDASYNLIIEFKQGSAAIVGEYYEQSATLTVPSDVYVLTENNPVRYQMQSVSTPTEDGAAGTIYRVDENGSLVQAANGTGDRIYFDLSKGNGEATFVSEQNNYGRASHTATVINQIKP